MVQVENLEQKNMVKLTIEVSAEELEKGMDAAFKKNKNSFNVPGFRKGKVTRQIVEKLYGPQVFYNDAVNEVINSTYPAAVEESKVDVVSQPELDVVQLEKGKSVIYTAVVAVRPEVTLGQYKDVEIEKINAEVTDEDIDADIQRTREQNSRMISVTDRAVAMDDTAIIDFEGFVDGVAFAGGKGENHSLVIGSHSFIDTFEDQLIGKNVGDKVDVNVTFPEDYHSAELKGKAALFKVEIKEIKTKELPEVDDEFAQDVSEFDTLEEYKADVRKKLEESKKSAASREKQTKLLEKIVAACQMDVPEAMIQTEVRRMADDFAQRLSMQGMSIEQYFQYTGLTYDAMFDEMKPEAEKRVKNTLVLDAIVKAEGITASDEDVQAKLEEMASMYKMEVAKLKELMPEDVEEQIKSDVTTEKALKLITDSAKEI